MSGHESEPPVNYFTCTLERAAEINTGNPSTIKTISQFLKYQADRNPEIPAAGFPFLREGKWGYELFSFGNLYNGSVAVAAHLCPLISDDEKDASSKCIALLCPSSIDFLFTWLALMRKGFSVLLIAPQCKPGAIVSLCKSCNATLLFHDISYTKLASSASSTSESTLITQPLPWQAYNQSIRTIIRNSSSFSPLDLDSLHKPGENDTAYIHHSSGTSTGIPKPIPQTHRTGFGVLPRLNGQDAATFTTTPLYHGGIADCFRAWTSNALIWLFPSSSLPITAKNIFSSLSVAENTPKTPALRYFSCVPYVLQMLAESPAGIPMLQNMELVGVGGAALSPSLGDKLVEKGVRLISRFGSAECGFLLSSHRDYATDKEWQYLRTPAASSSLLNFEPLKREEGKFELVVGRGWPHRAKQNREDGGWATSDVFEPHPRIANAWRYYGRSDSQVTLLTGKKFDPVPMEEKIASSSNNIKDAVVFGNERQFPVLLVFLNGQKGREKEEEVWEKIERINGEVENHARIGRNMMVFLGARDGAPEKSSKGVILRGPTEERFSEHMDALYRGTEENIKAIVDDDQLIDMVKQVVNQVLGYELENEADFYQHGVDSAKCIQIRSRIQKELTIGSGLPWNIVYDCGNLEELTKFLRDSRQGHVQGPESETQDMLDLVTKYSVFKSSLSETLIRKDSNFHVMVVTGTTGALGANILDTLSKDPSVLKIVCLVRAKDNDEARRMVSESLLSRKKSQLLNGSRILCVPVRLSQADLGLSSEMLDFLREEATHFIHAAWAVNFSLPLRSFVDSHIAGLYNLLNLAISCSQLAEFTFCSSTASVIRVPSPILEALSENPGDADTLGYSRSKWVAEAICAAASKSSLRGRAKIVRLGQLTGDTVNGVWNMSEAWPLMLGTVGELKCLPRIKQKLDWLPLDIAADAVVEITLTNEVKEGNSASIYHVLNDFSEPNWDDLLKCIENFWFQIFEVVKPEIWLSRLESSENHNAKRLAWLWEKAYGRVEGSESKPEIYFNTERTKREVKAIRDFEGLNEMTLRKIWLWIQAKLRSGKEEN